MPEISSPPFDGSLEGEPVVTPTARKQRGRDRHDRGMRGPAFGVGPFAPRGVPANQTSAERFDDIALRVLRAVVLRWADRLGDVELAVEEVPVIPAGWSEATVPLASYVDRTATSRPRLVLFRRPLEHRAETLLDLESLLLTVIVEQVAEVLGIPAEEVHPGYEGD